MSRRAIQYPLDLEGVIISTWRGQVNALNCSVRCPQRISSETQRYFRLRTADATAIHSPHS